MWSGFDGRHLWKEAGQEASRSLFHPEEFQVVHGTVTGTWYKPCPTPFSPRKLWVILLLQKLIKNAGFAHGYTAVKPRIFINWKIPRIPVLMDDVLHHVSSPHSPVPWPYSWVRASLLPRSVIDTDNLQHAQAAQEGPSTRNHRKFCATSDDPVWKLRPTSDACRTTGGKGHTPVWMIISHLLAEKLN